MKIYKPGMVTGLALAMVVVTAGGAYAYWSVNGSGTGTATVGGIKSLEIHQQDIRDLMLDKTVPVGVTVKNPNDFQVSLKGITEFTMTGAVDKDHRGCDFKANFKIHPPFLNPSIKVIGGHESVGFSGGDITLTNDPKVNQIACQGATVRLTYTLSQVPS